jgi:DNA-directed RNA polymerase subunit RPC12/RpoP
VHRMPPLTATRSPLCAIIHFTMGYKVICLNCRKAFNISSDYNAHVPKKCPECSSQLVMFNHKFQPPKQSDIKAWKVVAFLYENGFNYQHVQKDIPFDMLKNMPVANNMLTTLKLW